MPALSRVVKSIGLKGFHLVEDGTVITPQIVFVFEFSSFCFSFLAC